MPEPSGKEGAIVKYSENNPPLVCMQTNSKCYKGTRKMEIKGILWHDTGANNPNLKRYVQPSDNAPDREYWLKILGKNQYNNDWNHTNRQAGMNCWVGKLADGTVTTVQTMPWDYRPWGCGSGSKGSCNNGWIQFEICEDGKNNQAYFEAAYKEACEITAFLCRKYGIDPHGAAKCGNEMIPTILCHQDSHKLGLGSNHSDIYDWFPKYGKNMDTVRDDVARLLAEDILPVSLPVDEPHALPSSDTRTEEQTIWDTLFTEIGNAYGTAGVMGNLYAESGLHPNNLQGSYEKKLGMTDAQYTAAVDENTYTSFVEDKAGYGLAQWTYWSRKEALLVFAQEQGKSIGDLGMQLEFLCKELASYKTVMSILRNAHTVREASDIVLTKYEKPSDQSEAAQVKRAAYGQRYYDKYVAASAAPEAITPAIEDIPDEKNVPYLVRVSISTLNIRKGPGKDYACTGRYIGKGTFTIVEVSQGAGSENGWGRLKSGAGWISLDYCTRI